MPPLFHIDEVFLICRKGCLDTFGERTIHCRELPSFKYRHDLVRDIMFDIFRRVEISMKKETNVNFLINPCEGRSKLRPSDVLVYGWIGEKHVCKHLTRLSPVVRLKTGVLLRDKQRLKLVQIKWSNMRKHISKSCFIPFTFDTFDFLALEAIDLLQRVQKFMNNNIVSFKFINIIFKKIGFTIQKGAVHNLYFATMICLFSMCCNFLIVLN